MKGRKQKISKDSYRQKVGAEHRGYAEVPTSIWITENNEVTPPQEDGLLGKILNPYTVVQQAERLVGIALDFQPVKGGFCNDFGAVALPAPSFAADEEIGIVILPLPGQNHGKIESLRNPVEVDFANHRCLVTIGLHQFGKVGLIPVEWLCIIHFSVYKAVFAGKQNRTTGCTYRIGNCCPCKNSPFIGQPIDVWGLNQFIAVGTNSLASVVVTHDKQDVGPLRFLLLR